MPNFGTSSRKHRATLHEDLQKVLDRAILFRDFSIICGHRGEEDQQAAYTSGNSSVQWPHGKHNRYPSEAADVSPYPLDWDDESAFYLLAGYLQGIAREMYEAGAITHLLRTGADWDGDGQTDDQELRDPGHIELVAP